MNYPAHESGMDGRDTARRVSRGAICRFARGTPFPSPALGEFAGGSWSGRFTCRARALRGPPRRGCGGLAQRSFLGPRGPSIRAEEKLTC